MDLLIALKKENARIEKEIRKLEDTSAHQPDLRERLVRRLQDQVEALQQVEANHLYPLLKDLSEVHALVNRVRQEHQEITAVLLEMSTTPAADRHFEFLIENLSGLLRLHHAFEEHELYPAAREMISEEQLEMEGDRAQEELSFLRRQPVEV